MSNLTRFRKVCPAAGTFSKDPRAFWGDDAAGHPQFLRCGSGAYVTAEGGGVLLDWICALGANLLGYGNLEWVRDVTDAVAHGASFSLPTLLECEVAELLIAILGTHVPGWSPDDLQVRFFKTGSECTSAAVRLARAVTGRDLLLRCRDSYLGWGDTFIATTPPAYGIPPEYASCTKTFAFGKEPSTWDISWGDDFNNRMRDYNPACIILEQGTVDPPLGWYESLRSWRCEWGALLILDETATGFRYGLGGAAERFGVKPDIACYGKALGNGVAIAALVGRREYMEWFGRKDPVFCSGTFCGETLGLAGAAATLHIVAREPVMQHLATIGSALKDGLTDAFKDTPIKVVGHDVRHILQWPDDKWHAYIVRGMAEHGILLNRPNYGTWAHTLADVEETVQVAKWLAGNALLYGLPDYPQEFLPRVLFRNR